MSQLGPKGEIAPPPNTLKSNRYANLLFVARCLLLLGVMAITACPLPDYDIDPELNMPLDLRDELVSPPEGVLTGVRSCPSTPVEFNVAPAVDDPDGDRIFSFWYVNYAEGTGGLFEAADTFDFIFDPCTHPSAIVDDSVLIELIVMDRPPEAFTAAGARNTTDEGDLARLIWVVEIAEEGQCCLQ